MLFQKKERKKRWRIISTYKHNTSSSLPSKKCWNDYHDDHDDDDGTAKQTAYSDSR